MVQIKSACLTILLITVQWIYVDCCICDPTHPQTQFCNSHFAILATPIELISVDSQMNAYKLKIHHIYKMTPAGQPVITSNMVYTGNNVGLCGAVLELNKKYVLVGGVSQGKGFINLCGFVRQLSSVTKQQLRGLKEIYAKGCACRIKLCLNTDCSTLTIGNMCVAEEYDKLNCYYSLGACVPSHDGCEWKNDCEIDSCVRKTF